METYYSVLAVHNMIELCIIVSMIDNEVFYISSLSSTPTPEIGLINGLMGHLMNGLTVSLFYPSLVLNTQKYLDQHGSISESLFLYP